MRSPQVRQADQDRTMVGNAVETERAKLNALLKARRAKIDTWDIRKMFLSPMIHLVHHESSSSSFVFLSGGFSLVSIGE